jgi:hypothetical protein
MTLVVKYSKEPPYLPEAVGDNFSDLGRILGITASSISHSIHRNSELYKVVEIDDWYPTNDGQLWRYSEDGAVEYLD